MGEKKICINCGGRGYVYNPDTGEFDLECPVCGGTGKR